MRRGAGALGAALLALTIEASATAQTPAAQPPIRPVDPPGICGEDGTLKFMCGVRSPEDVAIVKGTQWVVTTSMGGGVYIVDGKQKKPMAIYPAANATERFDRATYSDCKGPPDEAEKLRFNTLGLFVGSPKRGIQKVYVSRYPGPSRVDVFDLDVRRAPKMTWIGCVPAPDKVLVNSIVAADDGSFIVSNFYETGPGMAASRAKAEAGGISADLWRWRPGQGWMKIPGTEISGGNGIEASRDGRYVYINQWGARTFTRMDMRTSPPKRDDVKFSFRPDNLHWSAKGDLLIAGHNDTNGSLVRLDPKTLKVTPLLARDDNDIYRHMTGAVEIGDEIWIGSSRVDRIAILPNPKPR